MKLLVLGGTVFLGRHTVEAALGRGMQVTLFNRGQHHPELFGTDVETLRGDRNDDLAALRGRSWDAVIDCSGFTPAQLAASGRALCDSVAHCVFVSSISVYQRFPPGVSFDDEAPLLQGHDGYGAQKARAEEAITAAMPGRVAVVRPGLIVGPHDPTGRFTHWPLRAARGGAVLAPGRPERQVQFIDVRDLAAWCLHLAEGRTAGCFNATGPTPTMQALLATCQAVAGSDARFVWLDDARLAALGVAPWTELPLWLPEQDAEWGGMLLADNRRALQAGLSPRSTEDTVRATLQWARGIVGGPPANVQTLTPEREAQCLADAAPVPRQA